MRKFYGHDGEIKVVPLDSVPEGKIKYCESPLFTAYPGCVNAYYYGEMERRFGTVKHDPNMQWYDHLVPETMGSCRDLPIEYCRRLEDKPVQCSCCGAYHESRSYTKSS